MSVCCCNRCHGSAVRHWNFCDGTRWNSIPEVLSQKDASWNGVPEPSFPGIGITPPLSNRIFGHLCVPELFFLNFAALRRFWALCYNTYDCECLLYIFSSFMTGSLLVIKLKVVFISCISLHSVKWIQLKQFNIALIFTLQKHFPLIILYF
jgi:hypothetical protein